ncbi:MAG: hypothetical protein GY774_38585 [Planctomycetes bacterium]|nr:hypothetical protein [Planctomycetota bacterium]
MHQALLVAADCSMGMKANSGVNDLAGMLEIHVKGMKYEGCQMVQQH